MSGLRQVVIGVLAALLSSALLLGSLSLALIESGANLAQVLEASPTLLASPTSLPPQPTTAPGEPTFTPTFTPAPSVTPTFPPPPTSCPPPQGWMPVMVQPGDVLETLAQAYGTTPDKLAQANCLLTTSLLPGVILYVPFVAPTATATLSPTAVRPTAIPCGRPAGWNSVYIVRAGDTLSSLSRIVGVSVAQIMQANCLTSSLIRTGERLYLPFLPPPPYVSPTPAPPTFTPPLPTPQPPPTQSPPTQAPPTVAPPTSTLEPTATQEPTQAPTNTPVPPTNTSPPPTNTAVPPTNTLPPPPTDTAAPPPTNTEAVPTASVRFSPAPTIVGAPASRSNP